MSDPTSTGAVDALSQLEKLAKEATEIAEARVGAQKTLIWAQDTAAPAILSLIARVRELEGARAALLALADEWDAYDAGGGGFYGAEYGSGKEAGKEACADDLRTALKGDPK